MIDTDLIVEGLRNFGHTVDEVIAVPSNAGEYEFHVDGELLSLTEARQLLADEQAKHASS